MWDMVEVPAELSERSEKMEREGVALKEDGVMCSPPGGAAAGKEEGERVDKVEGVRGPEERPGEGGRDCSKRFSFCWITCLDFRIFACNTPGDTSSTVVWVSRRSEVWEMECSTSASTFLSLPPSSAFLLSTSCG